MMRLAPESSTRPVSLQSRSGTSRAHQASTAFTAQPDCSVANSCCRDPVITCIAGITAFSAWSCHSVYKQLFSIDHFADHCATMRHANQTPGKRGARRGRPPGLLLTAHFPRRRALLPPLGYRPPHHGTVQSCLQSPQRHEILALFAYADPPPQRSWHGQPC